MEYCFRVQGFPADCFYGRFRWMLSQVLSRPWSVPAPRLSGAFRLFRSSSTNFRYAL